jgi:hypothetical protein
LILAGVPAAERKPEQRRAFEAALTEFAPPRPRCAHAFELDPWFLPAQVNLATLYNRMGRNRDAEHVLGAAIQRFPAARRSTSQRRSDSEGHHTRVLSSPAPRA